MESGIVLEQDPAADSAQFDENRGPSVLTQLKEGSRGSGSWHVLAETHPRRDKYVCAEMQNIQISCSSCSWDHQNVKNAIMCKNIWIHMSRGIANPEIISSFGPGTFWRRDEFPKRNFSILAKLTNSQGNRKMGNAHWEDRSSPLHCALFLSLIKITDTICISSTGLSQEIIFLKSYLIFHVYNFHSSHRAHLFSLKLNDGPFRHVSTCAWGFTPASGLNFPSSFSTIVPCNIFELCSTLAKRAVVVFSPSQTA